MRQQRTPFNPIFRPPSLREAGRSEMTWRAWSWWFALRRTQVAAELAAVDAKVARSLFATAAVIAGFGMTAHKAATSVGRFASAIEAVKPMYVRAHPCGRAGEVSPTTVKRVRGQVYGFVFGLTNLAGPFQRGRGTT